MNPFLSRQLMDLNDLIVSFAVKASATGNYEMPTELVDAIVALKPYIPPECPHNGEWTAHHRQGFNRCRLEVLNRGPL